MTEQALRISFELSVTNCVENVKRNEDTISICLAIAKLVKFASARRLAIAKTKR